MAKLTSEFLIWVTTYRGQCELNMIKTDCVEELIDHKDVWDSFVDCVKGVAWVPVERSRQDMEYLNGILHAIWDKYD